MNRYEKKKIYIYTNNIIYVRHTWICSYELLQQLKKKYIYDNVTYLSGKDEIMCYNIDELIMFIKLVIETKSISKI